MINKCVSLGRVSDVAGLPPNQLLMKSVVSTRSMEEIR